MDKNILTDRFLEAIDYLLVSNIEKTKGDISRNLNIKPSKFSEILNRRMFPGIELFSDICRIYGISPGWLLTGEGPMLRADESLYIESTTPTSTPVGGATSDVVTMRLMDKLDEKDTIIKEKEEKIEQLQTELRKQGEELAALKSMQPRHVSPYERYEKSKEEGHSKGMIR